jgi:hypothetical protein
MTFKDLRNRFSNSQHVQQQTTTHKNKPFWIWNVEEYKKERYYNSEKWSR